MPADGGTPRKEVGNIKQQGIAGSLKTAEEELMVRTQQAHQHFQLAAHLLHLVFGQQEGILPVLPQGRQQEGGRLRQV